ncbi:MAG: hypothetical protein LBU29_00750 [Endomicrobium sp.]|jgi:hypothetical protein|nr:hypothetical protein [Endomicrobium sp.]
MSEIKTVVAKFNSFSLPAEKDVHTQGSVICFWESHTKNPEDKENIQATSNLLHRTNLLEYEKYEITTGYLSRWNYMPKRY